MTIPDYIAVMIAIVAVAGMIKITHFSDPSTR